MKSSIYTPPKRGGRGAAAKSAGEVEQAMNEEAGAKAGAVAGAGAEGESGVLKIAAAAGHKGRPRNDPEVELGDGYAAYHGGGTKASNSGGKAAVVGTVDAVLDGDAGAGARVSGGEVGGSVGRSSVYANPTGKSSSESLHSHARCCSVLLCPFLSCPVLFYSILLLNIFGNIPSF